MKPSQPNVKYVYPMRVEVAEVWKDEVYPPARRADIGTTQQVGSLNLATQRFLLPSAFGVPTLCTWGLVCPVVDSVRANQEVLKPSVKLSSGCQVLM